MPPVLRDSCGPEGRTRTTWPPSVLRQTSPHEAGVELACPTAECEPQDAASMRRAARHRTPDEKPGQAGDQGHGYGGTFNRELRF